MAYATSDATSCDERLLHIKRVIDKYTACCTLLDNLQSAHYHLLKAKQQAREVFWVDIPMPEKLDENIQALVTLLHDRWLQSPHRTWNGIRSKRTVSPSGVPWWYWDQFRCMRRTTWCEGELLPALTLAMATPNSGNSSATKEASWRCASKLPVIHFAWAMSDWPASM